MYSILKLHISNKIQYSPGASLHLCVSDTDTGYDGTTVDISSAPQGCKL